jgi:hypothetical protein
MRSPTLFAILSALVVPALAVLACDARPVHPLDDDDAGSADDAGEDGAVPTPPAEPGRHDVRVETTRKIVPSEGLPPGAPTLNSNNNLDVVRFDGRTWLAWRTAPDHFASDKTQMVIVSSTDEVSWKLEKTFAVGADLREPRFLVHGGALFFYVSRLGADPGKFEPQGVSLSKRGADGVFSELAPVMRKAGGDAGAATPMTGYIAWRTKNERGRPFMTAYLGGEHIYEFDGKPLDVELLTTDDGATWYGVDPNKPVVSRGGGSEMDFAIIDDGTLFAIVRNEAGDETGWGSKVCRAPANDLASWSCKSDKRKYDSPLVFFHDGEVYLVGRRNVTATGEYDMGARDKTPAGTTLALQLDYRKAPKRCALWRVIPAEQRVAFILDLPSRGDTCFASRIDGASPDEIVLYNYSSDIDGADVSWGSGQNGPTFVYRHSLRFTRR